MKEEHYFEAVNSAAEIALDMAREAGLINPVMRHRLRESETQWFFLMEDEDGKTMWLEAAI